MKACMGSCVGVSIFMDKQSGSTTKHQEGKKQHLLRPSKASEADVKDYLIPGEHVLYQAQQLFFTDKRIIKHKHNWWARTFHFFYSTFEDLDLRFLESIRAKNVVNLRLLFWGCVVLLLGPIAMIIGAIPGLAGLGDFLVNVIVDGLSIGGTLLIGLILVAASVILRDRVVEFHGLNTVIRTHRFHDEELQKIRELQHMRMRSLGMEK